MEELAPEGVGTMSEDRGRGEPHPSPNWRAHRPRVGDLFVRDRIGPGREPLAEPLLGPRRACPTRVGEPGAPLDEREIGIPSGGEPGPDLVAHPLRFTVRLGHRDERTR